VERTERKLPTLCAERPPQPQEPSGLAHFAPLASTRACLQLCANVKGWYTDTNAPTTNGRDESHCGPRHAGGRSRMPADGCSPACAGCMRPARRGAFCRSGMALGRRSPPTSPAGSMPASGTPCWGRCSSRPMRGANSTGRRTSWMAVSSVPISTRLARGWRAARTRGVAQHALGRSRGGFSTTLHVRTERGATPLAVLLTAGERHRAP
jgi:hypothetical protein